MIGRTVSHYRIEDTLGEGGMGKVYLAHDLKLKRRVALKFLPRDLIIDDTAKRRFVREAEAAALLNHPNIITIHDIDAYQGRIFIVMEHVDGETLRQRMATLFKALNERDRIRETVILAIQICRGLAKAHQADIIHRDVKPENIVINRDNLVKIMDFGLAKLTGVSRITRDASTLGTARYMSPEQIKGEPIDRRSDIWSFGVVLYEMITGDVPFRESYLQALFYAILNDPYPPARPGDGGVPEELGAVVDRCLKKAPEDRYHDLDEVLLELKRIKRNIDSDTHALRVERARRRRIQFTRIIRVGGPALLMFILVLLVLVPNPGREVLGRWLFNRGLPEGRHLAVLSFAPEGADRLARAYGDGMAARIIDKLTRLEEFEQDLWVVPVEELRSSRVTGVKSAAKAFRIDLLLVLDIRLGGGEVREHWRILTADGGNTLQERTRMLPVTHLSALQDGLVRELVQHLGMRWGPQAEQELTAGGTALPGAFRLYLEGLGFLRPWREPTDPTRAIDRIEQALAQDDAYDEAHASLAEACVVKFERTGDRTWLSRAESHARRALLIHPGLHGAAVTLGCVHRARGEYEMALTVFRRALEMNPECFRARHELAYTLFFQMGERNQAEEEWTRAVAQRPGFWVGHRFLAYLYWQTGRLAEAEREFLKVIDLNPANVWTYKALFGIYNHRTDEAAALKARKIFEKSREFVEDGEIYSNMGTNLLYRGRYAEARRMYDRAIQLGGDSPRRCVLWGNLADTLRLAGEETAAADAYRNAVRLVEERLTRTPADPLLHASLALYLCKLGEVERALEEMGKALEGAPNDLEVMRRSVVVYELCGRRDRALKWLSEYLKRHGALGELSRNPFLARLHADPGYRDLVDTVNAR